MSQTVNRCLFMVDRRPDRSRSPIRTLVEPGSADLDLRTCCRIGLPGRPAGRAMIVNR
jgi:hypothetical protein